jgi:phosphonopyruvate decarboxylase
MIQINKFFKFLKRNKIDYFTGVPDSVLKDINLILNKKSDKEHFIATSEGSAVSLGIGYHLATNKIPCVYMQNSGLGNAINPLISIAHKKVYSIPLLLLIGWRGAPGINDEPQHNLKGKITPKLLNLLNIKYCILKKNDDLKKLKKLLVYSKANKCPVACLVKKNTLKSNNLVKVKKRPFNLKRKEVIEELLKKINKKTKFIATTGFTSRELNQLRTQNKKSVGTDFYMIGGMGHSSMVSLGASLRSKHDVICLDGDGSFIMHLGSIISIGKIGERNFKHILFNNFSHESVGGQTTNIEKLNIKKLVFAAGYKKYFKISKKNHLSYILKKFLVSKGPCFLEIQIDSGSIENLTRPKNFLDIKNKFKKSF